MTRSHLVSVAGRVDRDVPHSGTHNSLVGCFQAWRPAKGDAGIEGKILICLHSYYTRKEVQGTQCPGVLWASVEMGSVPLLPSTSLNCQTEQRQLQTLVYFSEEEIMNSLCSKWEIRKSLKKKIKPTSYPAMVNISIHFLPTCMHMFSRCHKAEITQGIIFCLQNF